MKGLSHVRDVVLRAGHIVVEALRFLACQRSAARPLPAALLIGFSDAAAALVIAQHHQHLYYWQKKMIDSTLVGI